MKVIPVYKPIGKTPLEILDQIRIDYQLLPNEKLAYAGRLDPMADGLLLVLVGEECKNRKEYERLPKEYEFEILMGISTDTYDVLGIIQEMDYSTHISKSALSIVLSCYIGKQQQPYPPFSAARINGKPLYYWARENKLSELTIPLKEIEIYSMEVLNETTISAKELFKMVTKKIESVNGEFRQERIVDKWRVATADKQDTPLQMFRCRITCSSGTYVRSIANEVGKKLGIPSLVFSIKRTRVGNYSL